MQCGVRQCLENANNKRDQIGNMLAGKRGRRPQLVEWVAILDAAGSCDPNYGGACVPIASDVDCAGGSGNGPAYVQGRVTVIGSDIYGLDSAQALGFAG